MKETLLFLLCLLAACPSYAANDGPPRTSLFFTPQEANAASILAPRAPPEAEGDIHLGAVLYYGPDDWVLWLQGKKWTPSTQSRDLRVLEVAEDEVRLAWRENGGAEKKIALKPDQSFDTATGKVTGP